MGEMTPGAGLDIDDPCVGDEGSDSQVDVDEPHGTDHALKHSS